MPNTQREAGANDRTHSATTEEARTPEVTVETVARLLANPRRTRRD